MKDVIFLDAVGTLFEVQESVGSIYSKFASLYGFNVSAYELNSSFREVFRNSPSAIFDCSLSLNELPKLEKMWWKKVVSKTFSSVMDLSQFSDFDQFFEQVFDYFATGDAWTVYPEVESVLRAWNARGVELGVVSNFDSRLTQVLDELGLTHYFSSITISTQVGVAKPSPDIFLKALENYHYAPQQALHIGDQWDDDFQGAEGAGLTGIWLVRGDEWKQLRRQRSLAKEQCIHRLDQLSLDVFLNS